MLSEETPGAGLRAAAAAATAGRRAVLLFSVLWKQQGGEGASTQVSGFNNP